MSEVGIITLIMTLLWVRTRRRRDAVRNLRTSTKARAFCAGDFKGSLTYNKTQRKRVGRITTFCKMRLLFRLGMLNTKDHTSWTSAPWTVLVLCERSKFSCIIYLVYFELRLAKILTFVTCLDMWLMSHFGRAKNCEKRRDRSVNRRGLKKNTQRGGLGKDKNRKSTQLASRAD